MSLSDNIWRGILDGYFRVPDTNVYVLGSFASHATLYSQQVRALNLITGLRTVGAIVPGTQVGVIGGGASGLMAAIAAAQIGARVVIVDRLPRPLAILRNSRQRYLHPHLYDWPLAGSREKRAVLPFFGWEADYAGGVAERIEKEWKRMSSPGALKGQIEQQWGATHVQLSLDARPVLTFHLTNPVPGTSPNQRFPLDIAIMAVGFGIEPEGKGSGGSYWSDDDLDGYFRVRHPKRQVLVSGAGDGALVDIMRLCLMDFRHDRILNLISNVASIDDLGKALFKICRQKDLSPEQIDGEFRREAGMQQTWGPDSNWGKVHESILEHLKPHLRTHDVEVTVASKDKHLYGGKSSILNRLIVSQLDRLNAFSFLPKEVSGVRRVNGGKRFMVSFKDQTKSEFDAVVLRHGPDVGEGMGGFPLIQRKCSVLIDRWRALSAFDEIGPDKDVTRERQWAGEWESESRPDATQPVHARELTIHKEVREDGNCLLRVVVEGLSAGEGELRGLRFAHATHAGVIGRPVFDGVVPSMLSSWDDDYKSEKEREREPRRLSGVLRFASPIRPGGASERVEFSVRVLNGHARTAWEHEQMYGGARRAQAPREIATGVEAFERAMWFPISVLRLRLSLPKGMGEKPPDVKIFRYRHVTIPVSGDILNLDQSHVDAERWELQEAPQLNVQTVAEGTWELQLENPAPGTLCRLEWRLPNPASSDLIAKAEAMRARLKEHGAARWHGASGDVNISEAFGRLRTTLLEEYAPAIVGEVDFSLITYDDAARQLVMVEARDSRNDDKCTLSPPALFQRQYGLGISGSCFKDGHHARLYLPPSAEELQTEPSLYQSSPGRPAYETLLGFPLNFVPESELGQLVPGDRARVCLGVVTVGTTGRSAELRKYLDSEDSLERIRQACGRFLVEAFPDALTRD